jgi:hypothetical protein
MKITATTTIIITAAAVAAATTLTATAAATTTTVTTIAAATTTAAYRLKSNRATIQLCQPEYSCDTSMMAEVMTSAITTDTSPWCRCLMQLRLLCAARTVSKP